MHKILGTLRKGAIAISVSAVMAVVYAGQSHSSNILLVRHMMKLPDDTSKAKGGDGDTNKLPYPIPKEGKGPIDLKQPTVLKKQVDLDSSMQYYHVHNQVDGQDVGEDQKIPFDQYQDQQNKQWIQDYFRQRSQAQVNVQGRSKLPDIPLLSNLINSVDGKKGPELIDIRPQGSATLTFSEDFNRVQNPNWSLREQRNSQFKFDQKIQVNVAGSIGQKIKLGINYDTDAAFDFENMRKINYQGKEDEIVKSFEVGDVSMPVAGSLISGSQSLFGVKTKLQFGKLTVTGVMAQSKSEKKEVTLEGGAQKTDFNIQADQYDANRHYFLAQYFRDHYDEYNQHWPALSNIQITRIEVWVTNSNISVQNTRAVAAFMDLGENDPKHIYNHTMVQPSPGAPGNPDNRANTLYSALTSDPAYRDAQTVSQELANPANNMTSTIDYYVLSNARQLAPTDFTYQPKLGYISLNQPLNPGEMLAVAFEYTINGVKYQVGEFARDVASDPTKPAVLFLKMLKSVNVRPGLPIWDLMMKNIYSLNSYQIQQQDFRLQVVYADDKSGADLAYLPVPQSEPQLNAQPLIRVMNLDRLNSQNEAKPDGNFDFLEGVTVNSSTGRVIFPVVEPFGSYLRNKFADKNLADYYTYNTLYDSTQWAAQQDAQKDKFFLRGSFKGAATNDISLNAINIPQGSVKVYAGGVPLTEGTDYTVDYTTGRVHIINNSVLNSGQVIKVEAETQTLFNIQQKTLMGTRAEYKFNKDFTLGGTFLYLRERPLTPKVNLGEEPIRNAIAGVDAHYRTDSRFLTKMVDRLPLIATKEMSNVAFDGEAAKIFPGHPKILNDAGQSGGVSYLDDFEGSEVPYDLRLGNYWVLASTPQGKPDMFPEASLVDSLPYNFRRARLSWYTIDNIFYRDNSLTPTNVRGNNEMLSDPYMREVLQTEVFPNKQIPNGSPGTLQTFDLLFRPGERGPYNYTIDGLDANGRLKNPKQNWGGIMRKIETNDFEASNISYIEFWVMDPFIKNPNSEGGDMYIDLGNVSEDILRDNRKSYENGLPATSEIKDIDTTAWGQVPSGIQINNSFANDPTARQFQDVGLDGLTDTAERSFFKGYLSKLKNKLTPDAYNRFFNDPSGDNFKFYRGTDLDNANANVIERYMLYNNPQGNTPISATNDNGYGSQYPDDEDINRDFNLDVAEDYFEYHIHMKPNMQKGEGYVTDKQTADVTLRNGKSAKVTWYQFKIPVREYDQRIGNISDFKSIRFMRMYLTGWQDSVIMRFGELQLVRSDWRKYQYSLAEPGPITPTDSGTTTMDISTVSIEKNGKREPIKYVVPPGIKREIDYSTPNLVQQNEQSLAIDICNLQDGDARAVVKTTTFDIRQYKHLRMFAHAEGQNLQDGQLHLFIRIGTDFTNNYYEYEMPLKVTRPADVKSADDVWPAENRMDVTLQDFLDVKTQRNLQGLSLTSPYSQQTASGLVTVIGNPDLSNIRVMMIGIRNPKDGGGPAPCAEIWVNELRVTDFNEQGGWAAVGRMTTKLADFGRVELTGSRTTIGFGGLEQTLQQRSQQDMTGFGINSTFQLGKFFPQRFNVQIPMLFSYSEQINKPKYNPLAPDLTLKSLLDAYKDDRIKQDSILRAAEDYTSITSLNFVGVQKLRPQGKTKSHFYDIENFNGTYIYNKIYKRNITSLYDYVTTNTLQLGYAYTFNSKPLQPFKKITNKNLHFISDFNLYYMPQSIRVLGNLTRRYGEKEYRNTDNIVTILEPLYDKSFQFTRDYELRHNFTKSLRFNYTADAKARVDEPDGRIDSHEKKMVVLNNISHGGSLTSFNQVGGLTYDLPISKFPYLDWVNSQAAYTGNYSWQAAPPAAANLGNIIQNSQTETLNGQLNFANLYSKNAFLRNVVQGQSNEDRIKENKKKKQEAQNKNKPANPNDKNKPADQKTQDNKEEPQVNSAGLKAAETAAGFLMSLRSIQFNYSQTKGTALPGFMPVPQALGQDFRADAPGFPFIAGSQKDIRPMAVKNGWLTSDTTLSALYVQSLRQNFTASITVTPVKNFLATVDFNKQVIQNFQENFRSAGPNGEFEHLGAITSGSYSISYLSWNTAFTKDRKDNTNAVFDQFESNRKTVSERLSRSNPMSNGVIDDSTGYYLGYSKYSQDVLIPSFLAAYSGKSANSVGLTTFPKVPLPNWSITYSGLGNIPALKDYVKSVNLRHGYHSVYSIDNYTSSLDYSANQVPQRGIDFINYLRIDRIVLQERFDPLFGFDVNWANNWTTGFDFKKDRTLSLSFTDRRLLENEGKEVTFRAGYRTNKLMLPFKVNGKKTYLKNDLTFRLDFSIRDNKQVIRVLDETTVQPTNGQRMLQFTPDVNYILSKNLTVDIFIKHTTNKPYTSNQYPTSFTSVGFSLRYILTP